MAEKKTIEFVKPVLAAHGLSNFLDFKDKAEPKEFPPVCIEIIDSMTDALMESVEAELPVGTLRAVESDLLQLTNAIVRLGRTDFSGHYKLSELEPLIDEARKKARGAINEHEKKKLNMNPPVYLSVDVLFDCIVQCRYKLEEARQKLEDFHAKKMNLGRRGNESSR